MSLRDRLSPPGASATRNHCLGQEDQGGGQGTRRNLCLRDPPTGAQELRRAIPSLLESEPSKGRGQVPASPNRGFPVFELAPGELCAPGLVGWTDGKEAARMRRGTRG